MSSIRQYQRGAIEALAKLVTWKPLPSVAEKGMRPSLFSTVDNDMLYYAGISVGEGTCAEIKGMNVLVLDATYRAQHKYFSMPECAYAVLLRYPTVGELTAQGFEDRTGILCVELLETVSAKDGAALFRRTNENKCYTALA